MSKDFKSEVRSIEVILKGSRWAKLPGTLIVLAEYKRLIECRLIESKERRTSLQILFSSRAIDSFLKIVVYEEYRNLRRTAPKFWTIGRSIRFLTTTGVNGNYLDGRTKIDLEKNVLQKRNLYLHEAGRFPLQVELDRFLASTVNGIREVSKL